MKRLFSALALTLTLASPVAALAIDYEHFEGVKRATGGYYLLYSYDLGFIDNALRVDVDIAMNGAKPSAPLLNLWESGIESIWSTNRFDVPILFNVDWVTAAENYDFMVQVVEGDGRWNELTWYTSHYTPGRVAAHEFGHMISLFDQYAGGGLDPATGRITNGLMASLYGNVLDEYYDPFLSWYEDRLSDFGGDGAAPVPEPGTFLLVGAGLLAVGWMKRRQAV